MSFAEQVRQWTEQIPLRYEVYGNTVQTWIVALTVFVVVLLVLRLVKGILVLRAGRLAEKRESELARGVADVVRATRFWFLLILSLYAGSLALELPETRVLPIVRSIVGIALFIQAGLWGSVLLTFGISRYVKQRMETDAAAVTTVSALGFVGKLILWSVVAILALENAGQDVSALIAGLGVGGIAVALAAQNILGDLFASLSIVLDKPFVLGDFIIVGDCLGTVEHIGLKTTRLRSLSGEQLVFSNTDLLQSRVRNYKRMYERRIVFTLGVTYQTPYEKLERIPGLLREAVEAQQQTRFDRAHFHQYGDFALIFEVVYYVLSPDYTVYMDTQQAINLAIFKKFEEEGLEFAYPTQTVYVQQSELQG